MADFGSVSVIPTRTASGLKLRVPVFCRGEPHKGKPGGGSGADNNYSSVVEITSADSQSRKSFTSGIIAKAP